MGYWTLISIYQDAEQEAADWETTTLFECPNDATTLLTGPHGELYCPFDGWQYFL